MKVVFLDMDGVLNSDAYFKAHGARPDEDVPPSRDEWRATVGTDEWWISMVDPEAVRRLNRVVHGSGAKVVVSSSWRYHCDPETMQRVLDARGFEGEVVGRTPLTPEMPEGMRDLGRGPEIEVWLAKNKHLDIEAFVILDDIAPRAFAHMAPYVVHTSWTRGMLDEHVEEALRRLS